jgi:hypothetical protein
MSKYTINEIELPSVTTILDVLDKPALRQWSANCACNYIKENYYDKIHRDILYELLNEAKYAYKNVSKEALDIGSTVHKMIEDYIKTGKDQNSDNEKVQNGFLAFLEWEKENIKKWIKSEHEVYNFDIGYAGTLDAIAELKNNKIYVIDFKSSKGFYDGYDMQIAAYRMSVKDIDIYGIDGMGVLRLDKETGMPEFKDYSKCYDQKAHAFIALVDYWYKAKNRRLKNNPIIERGNNGN